MRVIKDVLRSYFLNRDSSAVNAQELENKIHSAAEDIWRVLVEMPFPTDRIMDYVKEDRYRLHRHVDDRIDVVDQKLEAIRELLDSQRGDGPVCRWREESAPDNISKLILKGGPSLLADYSGKKQADESLAKWLDSAVEIICIDPFLFKRSHDAGETSAEALEKDYEYADQLLAVLGREKQVQFIYRGNAAKGSSAIKVSTNVANRIESSLAAVGLKATFRVVEDLHDRVWLKRDRKGSWSAKVIGTSRDGIGRRPTYLIDMSSTDCADYRPYVDYLVGISQVSHERPINFRGIGKKIL